MEAYFFTRLTNKLLITKIAKHDFQTREVKHHITAIQRPVVGHSLDPVHL